MKRYKVIKFILDGGLSAEAALTDEFINGQALAVFESGQCVVVKEKDENKQWKYIK